MKAKWLSCLALAGWGLMTEPGWTQTQEMPDENAAAVCAQELIVVTVWPRETVWPGEPVRTQESLSLEDDAFRRLESAYQQELGGLLSDLGVCYRFTTLEEATSRSFAGRIVVLRVLEQGAAQVARETLKEIPRSALAWTHASGRDVTPFGAVDLSALRAFLGTAPAGELTDDGVRQQGVAIARVAAHEIFHMLTRSRSHSGHGLMKSGLSRAELLAARAPSWTSDNRVAARKLLHQGQARVLAAVSGAQSRAAGSK